MDITIGDTIKRLRREKDITQEKLAENLNISCQAISKWERNECYPDITLLIPLASYFRVSVDELLGVDNAKNEIIIQEYIEQRRLLNNKGETAKSQELTKQIYAEFPNDFRVIENYISDLVYDINEVSGCKAHRDEILKLSNRILDECFVDDIRYGALFNLKCVYIEDGNIKKALATCDRFPATFYSKNNMKKDVYNRGDTERLKYIREHIDELTYDLSIEMRNIALEDKSLSNYDTIVAFKKSIDFLGIIYDKDDHCFKDYLVSDLYLWLGNCYIKSGDSESALNSFKSGLEYAKIYDELPLDEITNTSLFVRGHIFDMRNVSSGEIRNLVKTQLDSIAEWTANSNFKNRTELITLIDEYKPFAKDHK